MKRIELKSVQFKFIDAKFDSRNQNQKKWNLNMAKIGSHFNKKLKGLRIKESEQRHRAKTLKKNFFSTEIRRKIQ